MSLKSSTEEIFASNLLGKLKNNFSTIMLFGSSSPIDPILFTPFMSRSEYSWIVSLSCIAMI
ncbi:hypothetical protein Scep_015146 [Stephania cephalantha]|uniref:Uncharacterized protein n=1 Tax=Stephania cephalantha TaxID=152367 RepID=A0AAP0J430_9MAGN